MNNEDKKYLKTAEKTRPSLEVFSGMVQILKNEQEKVNKLLDLVNNTLLENCKVA
jgi:hypothetical protein